MTCDVSREDLWAWVHDEEDEPDRRARIAAHVAVCASCRRSVDAMRALVDDVRRLSGGADGAPAPLPERIGEFELVRKLGQGGMGVVFEAQQATPRRRVALKLLPGGQRIDEFRARMFQHEMHTLARLNHPAIAAIYAAGTTLDGQSYFAMELVAGQTLAEYVAAARPPLSIRRRLELFAEICDAVIHAHERGVVHRDLKPSNIMVTTEGRPKVLDFGLARVTERDVNAVTMMHESGRVIGTLQYMSPEQAAGDADAIDVRSDVYALGVILYELLTGALPYDVTGQPLHAALRTICEKPPLNPRALNRAAPRDVANIVLKALEKEPSRRYPTARALADDVNRFLTNHPVQARPAGRAYRLAKFVQRNTLATGLVATILALAIGAAVVFGLQSRRIAAERDAVRREARKTGAINEFLLNTLAAADPRAALGREITVREVVDRAALTAADDLGAHPETEAALRDTIGQVYGELAAHESADAQLSQALALRRDVHGSDHAEIAETLSHLAEVAYAQADYDRAERLAREAYEMRRRLFGPAHDAVARSLHDLGALAWARAELDDAERMLRDALALRREVLGPDHLDVAETVSALALLLRERGQLDEAETLLREVVRLNEQHRSALHPHLAAARNNLALVLRDRDRFDEAEALYRAALAAQRRVYGDEHSEVSATLGNLGLLLLNRGDYPAAREQLEAALRIERAVSGDRHPNVAMHLNYLAIVAFHRGELETAERRFLEALEIKRAIYGENHPEVAADLNNLGVLRQSAGDLARAEEYVRQALAVNRAVYGDTHSTVATNLNNLANLLRDQGEYAEAEALHREALAIREGVFGPDTLEVALSLENVAGVLLDLGRAEEALSYAQRCRDIRTAKLAENDVHVALAELVLGRALTALARFEDAEAHLTRARSVLHETFGDRDQRTQRATDALAALRDARERPDDAAHRDSPAPVSD